MSHRIVGLDIGTHAVKVVQMRSGLRTHEIEAYHEARLDAYPPPPPSEDGGGPAPVLDPRAVQALESLKEAGALDGDLVIVGYPLSDCVQTTVELPFGDRKKIQAVLPIQVEDQLPVDMEELTADFSVRPDPEHPHVHQVGVVATPTARLTQLLGAFAGLEIDPRIVEPGPARLLVASELVEPGSSQGTIAVVDIGHETTEIAIIQGGAIASMRSIRIGGQTFTARLARDLKVDAAQAEQVKLQNGAIDPEWTPGRQPQNDTEWVQAICYGVATELAQTLGRAFHGHSARGSDPVQAVYLCGGGAEMRGLSEFLAKTTGLEVRPLWHDQAAQMIEGGGYRAIGALGLAGRGLGHQPASKLNLRQGDLAFRGDYEFLRARALALGVAAFILIILLGGMVIAKKKAAQARVDAYADALCIATTQVFGECERNPSTALSRLGPSGGRLAGLIPETSAYEIFRDISATLVYLREEDETPVTIEKLVVDVQRDVIQIEGRTDTGTSVDVILDELGLLDCVSELEARQTQQIQGSNEFHFELRGQNSCQ